MQITFYKLMATQKPISFHFQKNWMTSKKGRVDTKRWAYETLLLKLFLEGSAVVDTTHWRRKCANQSQWNFLFEGNFFFCVLCVMCGERTRYTSMFDKTKWTNEFWWKQNVQESTGEFLHKCGHWRLKSKSGKSSAIAACCGLKAVSTFYT